MFYIYNPSLQQCACTEWLKNRLKNWALAGVAQWIEQGLQTKGLPVWFPVRENAWVVGQVPISGCLRGNHTLMFFFFSFPSLPLSKNKIGGIKKVDKKIEYTWMNYQVFENQNYILWIWNMQNSCHYAMFLGGIGPSPWKNFDYMIPSI